jgi:quinol-cytochrome oxidoreductase complex cytochrome b subunit
VRSLTGWLEQRFNLTEMFSFLTNFGLFPAELDTRLPLREAIGDALQRPMPSYARWPRVLGILSVLLFAFLILTGAMLAFYYQPTPTQANASVTILVRDVNFGWFVHQMHRWAGQALLLILLARAWRFFFQGLYRTPREALWVLAILAFLAATHADLTGRLLSWSAGGYWATVRAVEILYALPGLGSLFSFIAGGRDIDSMVLIRFYFMHVVMLPCVLGALFFLHFSGVRRVGLSQIAGEQRAGRGAYRVYLFNLLILTVVMLGALVTLATLAPAPFEKAADPFSTPAGARPPWYLLASYGFMESFPAFVPRWTRGLLLEAILAFTILLPFIDRDPRPSPRRRRVVVAAGAAVLLLWLLFTWLGYHLEAAR